MQYTLEVKGEIFIQCNKLDMVKSKLNTLSFIPSYVLDSYEIIKGKTIKKVIESGIIPNNAWKI